MSATYYRLEDPLPTTRLWQVRVPWELARTVADHPRLRQAAATLCVDPKARRASLVLWPGVDPRPVVEAVRRLAADRQAGKARTTPHGSPHPQARPSQRAQMQPPRRVVADTRTGWEKTRPAHGPNR